MNVFKVISMTVLFTLSLPSWARLSTPYFLNYQYVLSDPKSALRVPSPRKAPPKEANDKLIKTNLLSFSLLALKGLKASVNDQDALVFQSSNGSHYTGMKLSIQSPTKSAEESRKQSKEWLKQIAADINEQLPDIVQSRGFASVNLILVLETPDDRDPELEVSVKSVKDEDYLKAIVEQAYLTQTLKKKTKPSNEGFKEFASIVGPVLEKQIKTERKLAEEADFDSDRFLELARNLSPKAAPKKETPKNPPAAQKQKAAFSPRDLI